MTHLRKSPWSYIFGFHGIALLSILVIPLVPIALRYGNLGYVLFFILTVVYPLPFLFGSRVVMFEDRIESGLRWFPKTVERTNIVRAQEGKVQWNRGFLPGVVIWEKESDDLVPVAGSAPMTKRKRQAWIAEINEWVKATPDG